MPVKDHPALRRAGALLETAGKRAVQAVIFAVCGLVFLWSMLHHHEPPSWAMEGGGAAGAAVEKLWPGGRKKKPATAATAQATAAPSEGDQ